MKIIIMGGGVVGVTTAYELLKNGHEVTILDREPPAIGGASYGNAGLIAVGHSIAWGSPKAVKTWFNTMINPHPVFRMKPQCDPRLIRWGLKFLTQCTAEAAERNSMQKHMVCAYSQEKLKELVQETKIEYQRQQNGLLFLFRNPETLEESIQSTNILKKAGQTFEVVDQERIEEIIPEMKQSYVKPTGGIFSPTDETGDSRLFTEELTKVCQKMGGVFESGIQIHRLEKKSGQISRVVTNKGTYQADRYVMSLGAWSPLIAKTVGIWLSIFPVKGYSITVPVGPEHTPPSVGGLHEDDFLGFAPMGDHFRVSSVSEFAGFDNGHTAEDFEYLLNAAKKLFPNAGDYQNVEYWCGFRPMTPEGTPILGTGKFDNLYFNTGHGHLGWTMACGTARITADLIAGKTPEISCEKMKVR